MEFHKKRRQQFLGDRSFAAEIAGCNDGIVNIEEVIGEAMAEGDLSYAQRRASMKAFLQFTRLLIRYTAGEPIEPQRSELEQVIAAYERSGELLWKHTGDRNEVVFIFTSLDEYCQLMQLVGLCFLLHRRDLLPRLAALQDGLDAGERLGAGNGGTDTLYEEFMAFGMGADLRYETDWLCCSKPYAPLFHALTETTPAKGLQEIDLFLKRWYKDLAGTAWHDSHKPDEDGNQAGYYGYWSFEAGAAVLLLGIEDDSSLHKYLYYPKDLVAWSKAHASLSEPQEKTSVALRALAGEPCPREGYWFTPARANSRRRFKAGEVMPDVGSDYGATIWQWDERQTD